jgi:TonB family protein
VTAAPALPAQSGDAARPGAPTAADPAPRGESEIDPISVIGSVDFRRGSTVARLGRAHKLTRPRMTLGGKVDLMTIGSTLLVLKLSTDATGNVSSVDVARSSGSDDVDQLFRVTAYDWWFEPPKTDAGKPRPDTFLFVIRIN